MQLSTGTGDPAMDVLRFPGHDISGTTSSPPLVDCGEHAQLGGGIYLTLPQVVDAVHVARDAFSLSEKDAIATNIGALTPGQADELYAEIARQNALIDSLEANLSVPLAEVIDLVEERARRRPGLVEAPVA